MFKDLMKNLNTFKSPQIIKETKTEQNRELMELDILARTRAALEGVVPDPFKDKDYILIKKLLEISDTEGKPEDAMERKYLGASGQELYYADFDMDEETAAIKGVKVYNSAGEQVETVEMPGEGKEPLSNVAILGNLVDKLTLDSVSYKLLLELKIIELEPEKEEKPPEEPAEEPKGEAPEEGEAEEPTPEESVNPADFKESQSIFIKGFGRGFIREIKDGAINVDLDLGANVTFKELLKTQIMEAPIDVSMAPKSPGAAQTQMSPTAAASPGTNMFPSPEDKDAIKQGQGSYGVDTSGGKSGDVNLKNLKVLPGKVDKDAVKQGAGSYATPKSADPRLKNMKPDYTKTIDKDAVKQGASSIDKDRFVGKTGAPNLVNTTILDTKLAEKIWNFLFETPNSKIDTIVGHLNDTESKVCPECGAKMIKSASGNLWQCYGCGYSEPVKESKDSVITTMWEMLTEQLIQRTDEYHAMVGVSEGSSIKEGDKVKILHGKYEGKEGIVSRVTPPVEEGDEEQIDVKVEGETRFFGKEDLQVLEARGQGMGVGGQRQGDAGADKCRCTACGEIVDHDRSIPCNQMICPKCGGKTMVGVNEARGEGMGVGGSRQGIGGPDVCRCSACGYTMPHTRGLPCTQIDCPECGAKMVGTSESVKKFKGKKKIKDAVSDFEIEAVDEKAARDILIAEFPDAEISELEEVPAEPEETKPLVPKEEPITVGPSKEAQKVEITGVNTVEDAESYLKKLKVKTKTKVNLKDKEAVVYSVGDEEVARYDINAKILTINKVAEGVIPKLDKPVDASTIKDLLEGKVPNLKASQDKIIKDLLEKHGLAEESQNAFKVSYGSVSAVYHTPTADEAKQMFMDDYEDEVGGKDHEEKLSRLAVEDVTEKKASDTHAGLEKIDAKVLAKDFNIVLRGVTDRATAERFSKEKNGIAIRDSQEPTKFMVVVKKVFEKPIVKEKEEHVPEFDVLIKSLATVTEKSVEEVKTCWDITSTAYLAEHKKSELQPEDRKVVLEKVKKDLGIGTLAKVEEKLAKKDFSDALKDIREGSKKEVLDSLGKLFLVQQMETAEKKNKLLEKLLKNEPRS